MEDTAAWAVLESDVLDGDRFLLLRDDLFSDDQLQQRITEEAREQVTAVYRMSEMKHITEGDLPDQRKRELHELKKQFGGDVIGSDPAGDSVPVTEFVEWI